MTEAYQCPGSLMDKTVDSGSTDAGSIPARDTKFSKAFKPKTWQKILPSTQS